MIEPSKGCFFRFLLLVGGPLLSIVLIEWNRAYVVYSVLAVSACTAILIFAALYQYFRRKYNIIDQAISQIKAYIAGNPDAHIACDEEGELNRLFHKVNSLVTILNAHAEKESSAKRFLKDTISDISHQLKNTLCCPEYLQWDFAGGNG